MYGHTPEFLLISLVSFFRMAHSTSCSDIRALCSFFFYPFHSIIFMQSLCSVSPQVCPAGPPQGVRGVAPVQLLPRWHRSHMDGLLRELRHLGAELRQRVERYDRPGDDQARLAHHVCWPVSVSPRSRWLLCFHIASFSPLWCTDPLCAGRRNERTECLIKAKLRNIMTFQDLENITSKEVCTNRPPKLKDMSDGFSWKLHDKVIGIIYSIDFSHDCMIWICVWMVHF